MASSSRMEFKRRKDESLAAMDSSGKDKSTKGSVDKPILSLLHTINSHPSYFTTSSCSGRTSLFAHPFTQSKSNKKSKGGSWLFISHGIVESSQVLDLLFSSSSSYDSDLVFRFEPLIVAVDCIDVDSAQVLVSIAVACGFRESGVTSVTKKRVIVGIRCSLRLEVPLGGSRGVMVSPDYVRFLVKVANEKMEINWRRTDEFLKALWRNGFDPWRDGCGEDGEKISVIGENYYVKKTEFGGEEDRNVEEMDNGECVNGENGKNEECGKEEDEKNGKSEEENDEVEDVEIGVYENEKVDEGGKNPECEKEGRCADYEKEDECPTSDRDGKDHALVGSHVLHIIPIPVSGLSSEKLLRWGHSSVVLSSSAGHMVFIFGGFGGSGTHSRRNDSLLLDPTSGVLETVETADSPPSPRLGHTASLVGESIFIVGGRAGLSKIMNDVWVLPSVSTGGWRLVICDGCFFSPRHRHTATVVGTKIYIFGGVENGTVSSHFHVLDTESLCWGEVITKGEGPCPRHSHTMVAYGSLLLLFGGHDGKRPLGDLYSFDTEKCIWKAEEMAGKPPRPRFSHTMFIYKHFIGIIGGCPTTPSRELSFLDLKCLLWRHIELDSVGMYLFVRSTAVVSGDKLILMGGGSSCFAFGSCFTRPVTISLLPLESYSEFPQFRQMVRVERKYAKLVKDELKKYGWLDSRRKPYLQNCGEHVCFPVMEKFLAFFHGGKGHPGNESDDLDGRDPLRRQLGGTVGLDGHLRVVDIVAKYGACVVRDDGVEVRRPPRSPLKVMTEALTSLVKHKGMPIHVLREIPTRWEKLGDILVLPVSAFRDPAWDVIGQHLWPIVAKSLNTHRLARQGCVVANGTRDSTLEILMGDDGWVEHYENGIGFTFDATKCIFSRGNLSERLRMANLDCRNEVVVDLFAGIGYFVLPFLIRAKAKQVYACEWNPCAVESLRRNLRINSVAERCVILEGDNRLFAPTRVADRVCLGLLPTSESSWPTAVRALRPVGGVLHVHGNVKDVDETSWTKAVSKSIHDISVGEGYEWEVRVEHLQRVKWYAPHIRHLVADIRCSIIPR